MAMRKGNLNINANINIKKTHLKILLIEDDHYFRLFLKDRLKAYGEICECSNYNDSITRLKKEFFDLVLIDLNLDGENVGLKILECAKLKNLYSVILTDFDSPEYVKDAYHLGCQHFLSKDQFELALDSIIADCLDKSSGVDFDNQIKKEFLTIDPTLIRELKNLRSPLFVERPILILGETGVGKGKLAEFLHKSWEECDESTEGMSSKHAFVSVNASAIAENLIESEFFGHVKGAFTGANENKKGKLKLADGGTLFLDEIGSMPLPMQKKLLKALEEKEFYPVGGTTPVTTNFRLITATCEDINKKVRDGSFRSDLFYRINGVSIKISPLRERKKDIELLINHFLRRGPRKIHITEKALRQLVEYSWPGNVRELKAFVDSIYNKNNGIVDLIDLPEYIRNESPVNAGNVFISEEIFNFIKLNGMKNYLEKIEEEAVNMAMKDARGFAVRAKDTLKIPHTSFYRILKRISSNYRDNY
ncbi:MAG: sigma-54-dependent Fis family transcriptional regulator [Oligoflexia bacterium]|nr:sigma-54-dependent Fis family transcriptional regulator [Oligoflexia bacterium]